MPDYHFSYLVGVLIFWVAWVLCLAFGKSYRTEMRWGTLIATPMALTSILFVPQYWFPPSLFNLDDKIRVGIEDFLWAAAVGGIACVVGEILLKERLVTIRSCRRKRHLTPFVAIVAVFIPLEFWHSNKTIYNTIIAFALGAVVIAFLRSDLVPSMLVGALSFTALYFFLFLCVLFLYPDFIHRFYNIPNLLKIYVLGVPIEELLFASTGGAIFSVAYEYLHGATLSPAPRV
jgi:hypothetical protein